MNKAVEIIISDDLLLRLPVEADIQARFEYGSPYQYRVMSGGSKKAPEYTMEKAEKFYKAFDFCDYAWIIEYKKRMIGLARLKDRGYTKDLRYSIGIFDESLLGKGIGTDVTNALVDYAFEVLGMDSVHLMVLDINKRGIRCYEKCGFVVEKVLKDHHTVDGVTMDDLIMKVKKTS